MRGRHHLALRWGRGSVKLSWCSWLGASRPRQFERVCWSHLWCQRWIRWGLGSLTGKCHLIKYGLFSYQVLSPSELRLWTGWSLRPHRQGSLKPWSLRGSEQLKTTHLQCSRLFKVVLLRLRCCRLGGRALAYQKWNLGFLPTPSDLRQLQPVEKRQRCPCSHLHRNGLHRPRRWRFHYQ